MPVCTQIHAILNSQERSDEVISELDERVNLVYT